MLPEIIPNRSILIISGSDTKNFLQSLITNDVSHTKNGLVYTALLSPKGKYLFDFFIAPKNEDYLIDISSDNAYRPRISSDESDFRISAVFCSSILYVFVQLREKAPTINANNSLW